MVGIGVATFSLLVAAPMSADAATSLTPPSSPAAATSLPACSNLYGSGLALAPDGLDGVQLGWTPVRPSLLINPGSYAVQLAPMIPCNDSGYIEIGIYWNKINGTVPPGVGLATAVLDTTCVDVLGVTLTDSHYVNIAVNALQQGANNSEYSRISIGNCNIIKNLVLTLTDQVTSSNPALVTNWDPAHWTSGSSGFVPPTTIQGALGVVTESPIQCNIDNTGADIVAIIQHVVASYVNWFPCMFIPVGWDRADKINTAWTSGPVGTLVSAFKASVPGGISCGSVGTIPFFGRSIGLDTCQADFAPSWIKVVITYVMILGVGALAVRRIMWAVGSRA